LRYFSLLLFFFFVTRDVTDAGEASTLPAGSVARTGRVWVPLRRATVWEAEQGAKEPPSRLHLSVDPGSEDPRE